MLVPSSRSMLYAGLVALVSAPVAYLAVLGSGMEQDLALGFAGVLLAGSLGILGMYAATCLLRSRVTFDTLEKVVRIGGPFAGRRPAVPLAGVSALEIRGSADDSFEWDSYELSLVHGAGERPGRTCLLSHAKVDVMREQGARIADRIGVRLVDHTLEDA